MNMSFTRADKQSYSDRMARAIAPKLFFLMDVPQNATILDYDCGPGDVIRAAASVRPDVRFVGYDADPDMIRVARASGIARARFFGKEDEAVEAALGGIGPSVILFSSVLHEITTFGGYPELLRVLGVASRFDEVAIRDMAADPQESLLPDTVSGLRVSPRLLGSFVERWGAPNDAVSVAHLMLKARYPDNWEAENRENYFAVPVNGLMLSVSLSHPVTVSFQRHVPPFLMRDLYATHGRFPGIMTHLVFHARKSATPRI